MRSTNITMLSLAAWALLGLAATNAQEMTPNASYVAETAEAPGCRPAVLHIIRSGVALSGVVFFKDGSGVSSVNGGTDGRTFHWTMASMTGSGPVGEVTGSVSPDGALQAKLAGTNCTLTTVIQRYRDIYNGSG